MPKTAHYRSIVPPSLSHRWQDTDPGLILLPSAAFPPLPVSGLLKKAIWQIAIRICKAESLARFLGQCPGDDDTAT